MDVYEYLARATRRLTVPAAVHLGPNVHGGSDFSDDANVERALGYLEGKFEVAYIWDSASKTAYPNV